MAPNSSLPLSPHRIWTGTFESSMPTGCYNPDPYVLVSKHVVFGEVLDGMSFSFFSNIYPQRLWNASGKANADFSIGKSIVRKVENMKTQNDKPQTDVTIAGK